MGSEGRCDECGFDPDGCTPSEAVDALRSFGRRYRAPLTRFLAGEDADVVLRSRPEEKTWSALEYACHARDAFALYDERIRRALVEDAPAFKRANPDAVVADLRYNESDPGLVTRELEANAERLALTIEAVPDDAWDRIVYRDGEPLTVAWMSQHVVHEGVHHLLDIGRVLRTVRGR